MNTEEKKREIFQRISNYDEFSHKYHDYFACSVCLDTQSLSNDPAVSGEWREAPFDKCSECGYVDEEAQKEWEEWREEEENEWRRKMQEEDEYSVLVKEVRTN